MKISKLAIIVTILFMIGCQSEPKKKVEKVPPETIGLKFINDYINNIGGLGMVQWIDKNPKTTQKFKSDLKKMVDDGEKEAPGYGLGFDPVLDAQDYPDKGFLLKSVDTFSGYLTVFGKDWTDFELTIKLLKIDNEWMIDGCGIINIPINKQASRN